VKFFKLMKDGGQESRVWGFFLVEIKKLFSIVVLRFADGSREAYHSHAFNSISWVLKGELQEDRKWNIGPRFPNATFTRSYLPSFRPVITTRDNMHKVSSLGNTYVLSFRGPWVDKWKEFLPTEDRTITLTHGRKVVCGCHAEAGDKMCEYHRS
jgi:hypothetical protein